jgi:hypothetical protein
MAEKNTQNPTTGSESDISKAQLQQQPPNQASQQPAETGQQPGQFETGQQDNAELTADQAATGQAQPGSLPDAGLQGDTLTRQRTDIEGASLQSPEKGEAESGFVGAEGEEDTSSELIEDQDFEKGGQGAPEGK